MYMYMYVVFAAKRIFGVIVHVWCDNVSFVPYLQGILRCFAVCHAVECCITFYCDSFHKHLHVGVDRTSVCVHTLRRHLIVHTLGFGLQCAAL